MILRGVITLIFFDPRPLKKVSIFAQFRSKSLSSDHGRTPSQIFAWKVLYPKGFTRQNILDLKMGAKCPEPAPQKWPVWKKSKKNFRIFKIFFRQIGGSLEPSLWSKDEIFGTRHFWARAIWKFPKMTPKMGKISKMAPPGPWVAPGTKLDMAYYIPMGWDFTHNDHFQVCHIPHYTNWWVFSCRIS